MSFNIKKSSGRKELFSLGKFKRSLKQCTVPDELIEKIIKKVKKEPHIKTTKQLATFTLKELEKNNPALAALYNLKQALLLLGPTGYPFEQFVAKIFAAQNYTVKLNQVGHGFCINHELDLTAQKNKKLLIIECKFHNRQALKSDVKTPLYIKARFDDLQKAWKLKTPHTQEFHQAWIVTNTKFSSEALIYGKCVDLKMIDWSHPAKANLPILIQKYSLFPITTLTRLERPYQKALIKNNVVLCRDLPKNEKILTKAGMHSRERKQIIKDSKNLCSLMDKLNHS